MIYPIIKNLIESLLKTHKCKGCNSWVWEKDIDVISIKNKNAFISITCPKCQDNTSIKAEVNEVSNLDLDSMSLENKMKELVKKQTIDIKSLKDELDSTSSIEDLLN